MSLSKADILAEEEERSRRVEERKAARAAKRAAKKDRGAGISGAVTGFAPEIANARELGKENTKLLETIEKMKSTQHQTLHKISVDQVFLTEYTNRSEQFLQTESFAVFVADIEKNGQNTPIRVRPKKGSHNEYELIYGRKRLESCRALGRPVKAIIEDADDRQLAILQEVENLHRNDITPFERGRYYALLLSKGHFESQTAISKEFNLSSAEISKLLKLNELPDWVSKKICNDGYGDKIKRAVFELAHAWTRSEEKLPGIEENKAELEDNLEKLMQIESVFERIKKSIAILEKKKVIPKPGATKPRISSSKFKHGKTVKFSHGTTGGLSITLAKKFNLSQKDVALLKERIEEILTEENFAEKD